MLSKERKAEITPRIIPPPPVVVEKEIVGAHTEIVRTPTANGWIETHRLTLTVRDKPKHRGRRAS